MATTTPAVSNFAAASAANRDAVFAASANMRLFGYSFRESGGAAATFRIRNGPTGAAGTVHRTIVLAANEEKHEWFGPNGILSELGISVERVAGAADQSIQANGG